MKREYYQKPTMDVVQLQHKGMLMTSGDVSATMTGTFEDVDI